MGGHQQERKKTRLAMSYTRRETNKQANEYIYKRREFLIFSVCSADIETHIPPRLIDVGRRGEKPLAITAVESKANNVLVNLMMDPCWLWLVENPVRKKVPTV